jgi:hypothetical protein
MKKLRIDYNRGDEIIEIIIRDSSGAKIDTFKSSMKDFPRILRIIERKYGLNLKKDRDIDWLKKDVF